MTRKSNGNDDDPRAACYVRVSTSEQARPDKPSLAQQEEKARQLCAVHDWQVVAVYTDVVSGKRWERPDLQRLLADARAGAFARVVFLKIDRLGRNTRDILEVSERLAEAGVAVVSVRESFDTSTPTGKFYFTLLGALAELEAGTIAERTVAGRVGRVQGGKYQASRCPYGYTYSKRTGKLKVDKAQAEVVRRIFGWSVEGAGLRVIAGRLAAEGIAPPSDTLHGEWHLTTLSKLLRSARYVGRASYGGEPMRCPAIVDEALFLAANTTLKERNTFRHHEAKHDYLLQDTLFCRTCGSKFMSKTDAATGRQVYMCRRRRVYGPKAGHEGVRWRWRADEIEPLVKRHVARLLVDPTYLLHEAELYEARASGAQGELARAVGLLRERLTDLDCRRQRAIDLAVAGRITTAEVEARLTQLQRDRADAEAELASLEREPLSGARLANWAALLRDAATMFAKGRELLPQVADDDTWVDDVLGSVEDWRGQVRQLVTRVWVETDGSLTFEGALGGAPSYPSSR